MDTNLTKETLLALERATKTLIKDQDVRDQVGPGTYQIDANLIIHLVGTLKVGEDFEYTPTVSIPFKKVLALFSRYCGVTREAALAAMVKSMKEAFETGDDASELIAGLADLEEAEKQVQESLGQLPKQEKKGTVTGKAVIASIDVA